MPELKTAALQRLADLETPVSAYLKIRRGGDESLLLESAEAHERIGRYSILADSPLAVLELWPDRALVQEKGTEEAWPPEEFFNLLRQILARYPLEEEPAFPAVGSLAGYIGYDAVRFMERLRPPAPSRQPLARLILPTRFLIFDNLGRTMTHLVLDQDEDQARRRIKQTEAELKRPLPPQPAPSGLSLEPPPKERFLRAVNRAKEHIRAGDIFQVVLADRYLGRTALDPFALYRLLRVKSPSPYMFFLDFQGLQIAGASPETLVRVREGEVMLRPIAGTRGRSRDPEEDRRLEEELLASEKERAEHVMLVDLARNDAGRVSQYGTVEVEPFMAVERFSHIMHLTSQVRGRLRQGADMVDAFKAAFPAGTLSGAPKVRAMEIIDQLESGARGVYGGAVGHFGPGERMDACIAIRMILFEDGRVSVPVGAGIVADSDPEAEYREIMQKAAQSISVLRMAAEEAA